MNSSTTYRMRLALGLLFVLAFGLSAPVHTKAAAASATITFRKVFKSSYPEFVEIKVSDTGTGIYDIRQLSDEASPQSMSIDAPIVQQIFELAAKLHNFDGVDLEMHRRIANLGSKTFRYDRGSETHSVTFNYTLDRSAAQLLEVFEDLARQQTALSDLERTMHYDRLGVNDVIEQVEADFDKKLLPEPQQFLAPLDQIAADTHFIDIARDRARALAGRIRSLEH
jgi:hypothetical protein